MEGNLEHTVPQGACGAAVAPARPARSRCGGRRGYWCGARRRVPARPEPLIQPVSNHSLCKQQLKPAVAAHPCEFHTACPVTRRDCGNTAGPQRPAADRSLDARWGPGTWGVFAAWEPTELESHWGLGAQNPHRPGASKPEGLCGSLLTWSATALLHPQQPPR